jgi:hypothetical protein
MAAEAQKMKEEREKAAVRYTIPSVQVTRARTDSKYTQGAAAATLEVYFYSVVPP